MHLFVQKYNSDTSCRKGEYVYKTKFRNTIGSTLIIRCKHTSISMSISMYYIDDYIYPYYKKSCVSPSVCPSVDLSVTPFSNYNNYLLLLKKVCSARLRESDVHPISPKTPAPQHHPIDRKNRKGKRKRL